eukprot:TRINITY_DN5124_c0_g1_i1.p1 TRINITY_DN5124_c0_g1~~TRINITY_DN5124_c0_g1_i1.p1  ORF type:complete len:177 (+),score=40.77 TRINITY_DN5124_c0_g1_i1:287-817(+)
MNINQNNTWNHGNDVGFHFPSSFNPNKYSREELQILNYLVDNVHNGDPNLNSNENNQEIHTSSTNPNALNIDRKTNLNDNNNSNINSSNKNNMNIDNIIHTRNNNNINYNNDPQIKKEVENLDQKRGETQDHPIPPLFTPSNCKYGGSFFFSVWISIKPITATDLTTKISTTSPKT